MDRPACILKDLPVVLEAFRLARERFPMIRLWVAGAHGGGFEEMKSLVRRLGIFDCVRFPGRLPNREMAEWMGGSTAFVTATRFETFGVAVAEAMACGLPIVTTDLPALREVAGSAALFVPGARAEGYAEALCRVLSDPECRRSLGAAARARICLYFDQEARREAMRRVLAELGIAQPEVAVPAES